MVVGQFILKVDKLTQQWVNMEKIALSYDNVEVLKFVYDFDTDDFELVTDPMRYYDKPYHSDLASKLQYRIGDDYWDHQTVEAYFLLEDGDNALDQESLPAMTIAARSDMIPTIVNAFRSEGWNPQRWYNARDKTLTDIPGGVVSKVAYDAEDYDEEDYDSDDSSSDDYETVDTMKFVYDEDNDVFHTGDEPQTYYDRPHHSDLMERMAEETGNWDQNNVHSGYLYLQHSPNNALTYGDDRVWPGTIVTTIPPHPQIIDHFRQEGHPVTHWYDASNRRAPVMHEIPAIIPKKTESKLAEVGDFSLIKFVALPDKFLVGENTHHAYLLGAEYGSKTFPATTTAIGRAWLENGKIHGVGFDYGTPQAQRAAIDSLGEWAQDHGYDYSPNMEDTIIGLASTPVFEKLQEVADSIKHCGDYGQCYWNAQDGTVFWNMGDADGPPEYDGQDEIRAKFLTIPEVKDVEFGDESGPPGGWYQIASEPLDKNNYFEGWIREVTAAITHLMNNKHMTYEEAIAAPLMTQFYMRGRRILGDQGVQEGLRRVQFLISFQNTKYDEGGSVKLPKPPPRSLRDQDDYINEPGLLSQIPGFGTPPTGWVGGPQFVEPYPGGEVVDQKGLSPKDYYDLWEQMPKRVNWPARNSSEALASTKASAPTAFVFSNGHMYYGIDHAEIMDEHDAWEGGLYGRLHERPDGRYDLELYSDYDKNQTKRELEDALPILQKRWNIAEINNESLISPEDMADAEQFFE